MQAINTIEIVNSQLNQATSVARGDARLTWWEVREAGKRAALRGHGLIAAIGTVDALDWDDYLAGWLDGERLATEF